MNRKIETIIEVLLIVAIFWLLYMSWATSAHAEGTRWINPGTPSGYDAVLNKDSGRLDLCWSDEHGHGNCMDVGEVFEIIRKRSRQVDEKGAGK